MPSCVKLRRYLPTRATLLRWSSGLSCGVPLVAQLWYWQQALPTPGEWLALHLLGLLMLLWQLREHGRSINLQPQELAQRMLKVQESERQHLSRELHDDIGQLLTAAKLQVEWLQRRVPGDLASHCNTVRSTLEQTLTNVRDLTTLLNPRQLSSLGLEASLRAHLMRTLQHSPVRWTLHCPQRLDGVPAPLSMAAFRITQEAVTNLLRHARAENLHVEVRRNQTGLLLRIEDDGAGFTPVPDPVHAGQRGLAGMHERALALQGSLALDSEPGRGTRIEAKLPWPTRTHPRARSPAAHDL
ncbi:sensor histidine kinase [Pseudomonas sp. UBA6562]|uniref:sensor histidine kinase n=1 Tax=Pseudomonas sp. UBA6562 TaxID=1947332 RepID=UPI0039C8D5A1